MASFKENLSIICQIDMQMIFVKIILSFPKNLTNF